MYATLSLTVIFCAIRCRSVLGYSTGPPTIACRDMVPRHDVSAQNTPVPFLVEVSKTRYSPNESLFVRIKGCRSNRFKGFYIQSRLAQYPDSAIFLGTFGRVGGTQYTCDQNGGVLTHIDASEKESITLVWMAPPRPAGHVIFRVTFVQSYRKFWVGVNSPVVSDGVSSELGMMESFSLQTVTDSVCLPTASRPTSRSTTSTTALQPVISRTMLKPTTTTTTERTTTTEKKSTAEPTTTTIKYSTTTTIIPMTTISTTISVPTTTTAPSTTSATTTTTKTIPTPTTAITTTVKPTTMKSTSNTTIEPTPTTTSKTASTQQPTTAMIITTTAAASTITETSQPTATSVTTIRLTITTATEPVTTETAQRPIIMTTTKEKVLTTTPRETTLGHVQTSQIITRTTVNYLNTTPSIVNQTDDLNMSPNIRCGSLQGCFDDCEGDLCSFIVAWQDFGRHIRFEIKKKMDTTADHWVAIGFSDDKMMGHDSVIECISESGVVKVYQSYNLNNYRNVRLVEPSVGLSDEYGSLRDGIFSCSFTRDNNVRNEIEIFNLKKDWYLMYANGGAVQGLKLPHEYTVVQPVSEIMVDFQSYPPMHLKYKQPVATTTTADPNKSKVPTTPWKELTYIAPDPECGIRNSCFQNCNTLDCQFVVSWNIRDEQVTFKLRAVALEPTNQWIAIAFSDDEKMGDDSVIQCVSDENNIIRVKQSYNKGKNNFEISNATKGIYNVNASFIDGILSCDFTRDRIVHGEPDIFNLDRKWKLFFAQGRSKRGNILPHDMVRKPQTSEDLVDFSHNEALLISAPIIYIKFHSCLMIFTWCFAASISAIIGRYFQPVCWGDKVFGSKSWAKVHRLFVVITVLGVIAGLIMIFVGVEGISTVFKKDISSLKSAHPVVGLLVTFLALLCPVLLIFRPLEGTASRSVFNGIYWLVESITLILAVVTMFAGLELSEGYFPFYLEYLFIGYAAYQVLITIIFESIRCYDVKKEQDRKMEYLYELYVKPWSLRRQNSLTSALDIHETRKSVKRGILGTNILILAALVLSIIIIIVTS